MDNDASAAIYSDKLKAYASVAEHPRRLENPALHARVRSAICGSVVDVDLNVKDGRVTEFGFAVEACALTKTVLAIMQRAIIGKTQDEIKDAGDALRLMLQGKTPVFSADWAELLILEPVKDYKARHNAVQLPFEAVEKSFNIK